MLNFVEEARGVAVGQTEASGTFGHRHRMFQGAEKERVVVDIGNDKTEEGRPWKFELVRNFKVAVSSYPPPSFLVLHSQVGSSKKGMG